MGKDWHVVQKVYHRHLWDIPENSNDIEELENLSEQINDDAYQEDISSNIRFIFEQEIDLQTEQVNRPNVELTEVDKDVYEAAKANSDIIEDYEEEIFDFSSESSEEEPIVSDDDD